MKKKTLLALGLAVLLVLCLSVAAFAAEDLDAFPAEVDPQSWGLIHDTTWDNLTALPAIDWTDDARLAADCQRMRGLVILVDFEDMPFVMTMPKGSDFLKNPTCDPIPEAQLADYYKTLLNGGDYLHGLTIDGYWRENSYGHWAVDLEVVGPYTLPGAEWEYGVDSYQGARSARRSIVPDSVALFLADQLSKPESERENLSDYNFGFVLHAGYDESGIWEEASVMMFNDKNDIADEFGPTFKELEDIRAYGAIGTGGTAEPVYDARGRLTNDIGWAAHMYSGVDSNGVYTIEDKDHNGYPDGENWIGTRYVEFSSWKAGRSVWSFASSYRAVEGDGSGLAPGTSWRISCQGESDGMATFAHEFGHIKGIADNYNNQFQTEPYITRAYVGNWEIMGNGSKVGPYGTHSRYTIPSLTGDVAAANHIARLKIKQEFYDDDQIVRLPEADLESGPVIETIVARNIPAGKTNKNAVGYGINALVIDMEHDDTPIIAAGDAANGYLWNGIGTYGSMRNTAFADRGYYQFYSVEVVQQTGYESFMQDSGVLICMNREIANESAPWSWVIDAHIDDINRVDYIKPNGDVHPILKGKADQLADALFHAGNGKTAVPAGDGVRGVPSNQVVNTYIDTFNGLSFYVLDVAHDKDNILSYRVAVAKTEKIANYSDQMSVSLGDVSPAKPGKVAVQNVTITNNGTKTGLYRLAVENTSWTTQLENNLVEVEPGKTVTVPLYMQVPQYGAKDNDFALGVTSEISGKSAELEGTVKPTKYKPVTYAKDYDKYTTSVNPGYEGKTLSEFPELDPQSWKPVPSMTWEDLQPHPYIDWTDDANLADDCMTIKGLIILCDFEDQPFVMTMDKGSDFLGNPQTEPIARGDLATFYQTLLNGGTYLHGMTIDKFWRENSYGKWRIELDVCGPYLLPGMEWEYGIDDMNGADGARKDVAADAIQLFLKDNGREENLTDYDFGFILHAGYDESGIWQEASEMMFDDKYTIPDTMGPTMEELEAIRAFGSKQSGGMSEEERVTMTWGSWTWSYVVNDISWAEQLFDNDRDGHGDKDANGVFIIKDADGNGYPDGWNYAGTRYVEYSSWKAARTVWSYSSSYRAVEGDGSGLAPGTGWRMSVQGESDGMGTFAHEFGHIRSINDNYNNQFQLDPLVRTYVGNWELMGAGDKSGPFGTHSRWEIPSVKGDIAPSNHVVRLKIKQGFYEEDQLTRVPEQYLIENGPVFETIVARNTPAGKTNKVAVGYGVNGLVVDLDKDNAPIVKQTDANYFWADIATFGSYAASNKYYDIGYYQFYAMEVIQRRGSESFMTDEGVMISLNREIDNESAPWTWIIDSHPALIPVVDFYRPNGEAQMMLPGKNDQLADALFHMGAGATAQPTHGNTDDAAPSDQVVSEYLDTWNNLHFYVLDKMYDEQGVLSYRVAVASEEFNGSYSDQMSVTLGDSSPAKSGKIAAQEVIITNNGSKPGLYRLTDENEGDWNTMFPTNVIEVAPGETVSIPLYLQVPTLRPMSNDFKVTVTSEVSGKSASTSGTVKPDVTPAGTGAHDTTRPGSSNVGAPVDVTPTEPVDELPFIDVNKGDWFYNDVLVAYKDGLVNGRTATTYVPEGNITVAEAIKLAACMNQLYTDGKVSLTNGPGATWYSTYVDYCAAKGIIKADEYTEMDAIATRAQFATIFAAALPEEALPAINNIADGKIPDVKMADSYGAPVYKLYNAGILIGNDAVGTFAPNTNIKRSEVATILNRMMHKENRKKLDL